MYLSRAKRRSFSYTALGVATFLVSASTAYADVMTFPATGQIETTSGWVFHDQKNNSVGAGAARGGERVMARTAPRTEKLGSKAVRSLVAQTIKRHSNNAALRRAGLNASQWSALFTAMIRQESGFNPTALSPKGAIGLGQLMPATAKELGVDPHDPAQNLDGAARYLLAQLNKFGSARLALAAYNAGPHRVEQYSDVPPFKETQNYVRAIGRRSGLNVGSTSTALLRPLAVSFGVTPNYEANPILE